MVEHSVTGKFSYLAALAPATVKELRDTNRMTRIKRDACNTIEELLRPLVLLVDDDAEYREVLSDHLHSTLRCRVVEAQSADQALQMLEDQPVSVVVADLQMPIKGGLELLAEARTRWPHVARVLMSSGSDPAVGADGPAEVFLPKGVDVGATVRGILGLIDPE